MTADTARADYTAGLRRLADALDTDGRLEPPRQSGSLMVHLHGSPSEQRDGLAAWLRQMDVVSITHEVKESGGLRWHQSCGRVGPFEVVVCASVEAVCVPVESSSVAWVLDAASILPDGLVAS